MPLSLGIRNSDLLQDCISKSNVSFCWLFYFTVIPILLGNSIPLFGNGGMEQSLELIEIFTSDKGSSVQKRYRVKSVE
jgi:dihydrofolate reductase